MNDATLNPQGTDNKGWGQFPLRCQKCAALGGMANAVCPHQPTGQVQPKNTELCRNDLSQPFYAKVVGGIAICCNCKQPVSDHQPKDTKPEQPDYKQPDTALQLLVTEIAHHAIETGQRPLYSTRMSYVTEIQQIVRRFPEALPNGDSSQSAEGSDKPECPDCEGSGVIHTPTGHKYAPLTTQLCETCRGTGLVTNLPTSPSGVPLTADDKPQAPLLDPAEPERDYAAESAEIAALHERQGHDYQCSWCGAKPGKIYTNIHDDVYSADPTEPTPSGDLKPFHGELQRTVDRQTPYRRELNDFLDARLVPLHDETLKVAQAELQKLIDAETTKAYEQGRRAEWELHHKGGKHD